MSILKTSLLGNPILRQTAEPISLSDLKADTLQKLIDDMIVTMHEYEGVGLAAPQVHESLQLAVIEVRENQRYPSAPAIPLLTLVNPEFIRKSDELQEGWEGCLSIEGLRGLVPRSKEVEIRYWDRQGEKQELTATGFAAVVIQHELDHLAGMVFLDRMSNFKSLCHLKEYQQYWTRSDSPHKT